MQIQLPLFVSFEQVKNLPIVKKYEAIFSQLDMSHIPEFNYRVGADGTSQHALIRAFIIKSLESLNEVSALIRFLEANPALVYLCNFRYGIIPHNSQFYRFLKKTPHSLIEEILIKTNKTLIKQGVLSHDIVVADSKPVKALTKNNNPKNIHRNLKDKTKKPRRNPQATLGYYSYTPETDPITKKKNFIFFWGYRTHVLLDPNSGLVLIEGTFPNNMTDEKIARKLLTKLRRIYHTKKGMIFIGDAAFDVRDFYTFLLNKIKAEPIIPINPRNTKQSLNYSKNGHRICDAGLEMTPFGTWSDGNRLRLKERCPLKVSKKIAAQFPLGCPCNHTNFNGYGCTAYQDVTHDARSQVQRNTPRFEKLYNKRHSVELDFARVHALKIEDARHFSLQAVRNSNTIDYISLALVALAAVRMKKPHKIRCFRSFAQAA